MSPCKVLTFCRCMFFRSLKILFVKIQIQICSDYVILVLINHLCFMWTVRHTLNIMVNLSFYESVNPCLNRSKILWLIFVIIVHGSTDLRRIKLKWWMFISDNSIVVICIRVSFQYSSKHSSLIYYFPTIMTKLTPWDRKRSLFDLHRWRSHHWLIDCLVYLKSIWKLIWYNKIFYYCSNRIVTILSLSVVTGLLQYFLGVLTVYFIILR